MKFEEMIIEYSENLYNPFSVMGWHARYMVMVLSIVQVVVEIFTQYFILRAREVQ